jgi:hypothetical protein
MILTGDRGLTARSSTAILLITTETVMLGQQDVKHGEMSDRTTKDASSGE